MRDAHLDGADLRLRARRQATTPSATQKAGQEHHAALEHDPLWDGPSLAVEGATTARVFEAYVKKVLAPSLLAGQVVVMDNLGAHRPTRVRELVEQRGCELLYLPSYSPDLNPIEEAFAKIKHLLREACARSRGALVEAMGVALSAISTRDARGFFEHAGYRPAGQLL